MKNIIIALSLIFWAAGCSNTEPVVFRDTPYKMIFVKAGTAGGISVEKDFYIGKYEVTQREWKEVMKENPSNFKKEDLPVENISWYDAIEYCNALSKKEGLQPVYTINKKEKDPENFNDTDTKKWKITADFTKNGYRLPLEKEWRYAQMGGVSSQNTPYSGSIKSDDVAWTRENSKGRPHSVGSKGGNELGIYDMSGNVWEWCWDWSSKSNNCKVLRGGSWNEGDYLSDATSYNTYSPNYFYYDTGFRVARNVEYK